MKLCSVFFKKFNKNCTDYYIANNKILLSKLFLLNCIIVNAQAKVALDFSFNVIFTFSIRSCKRDVSTTGSS